MISAAGGLVILLLAAGTLLGRYYAGPDPNKVAGWRQLAAVLNRLAAGRPAGQVRLAQNYPDPALW